MKKLLYILLLMPIIGFGQLPQTNLDFRWVGGTDANYNLKDSLTGLVDLNYKLLGYNGDTTLTYVNAKDSIFLVAYGDTIPVICLFENYNYADTLYFKMDEQTIGANNRETLPYRLTSIAHYSTPTDANDWFGVIPKGTVNIREVGIGKTYATIDAAYAAAANDDTIYVYTGDYAVNTLLNYFYFNSRLWVKAVGNASVKSGAAGVQRTLFFVGTGSKIFEGFTLDGSDAIGTVLETNTGSTGNVIRKCFVINHPITGSNDPINMRVGSDLVIENNAFIGNGTSSLIRCDASVHLFDECYIEGGYNVDFSSASSDTSFSMQYCDIKLDSSIVLASAIDAGEYDFKYNNITVTDTSSAIIYENTTGSGVDITFRGNVVTLDTATISPLLFGGVIWDDLIIDSNDITVTDTGHTSQIILVSSIDCPITIEANFIDTRNTSDSRHIQITSAGTVSGEINILNNESHLRAINAYAYRIGTESSTVADNALTGNITGNKLMGPLYWDETIESVTIHGIFVGFNRNWTIKNNYVDGCGINYLVKSSSGVNTSGGFFYNISKNAYIEAFYSKGHESVKFYNNTSINFLDNQVRHFYLSENGGGDGAINCEIKNNLVYDTITNVNNIGIHSNGGVTGTISNYNLFYLPGGSFAKDNTTLRSLSSWQSATGQDLNSYDTDPNLKSFTEFWPVLPSSAINNGVNLGVNYKDGLGISTVWPGSVVAKDQKSVWDIGAFVIGLKSILKYNASILTNEGYILITE